MTRSLAFTKLASTDVEDAHGWYEARRPGLGDEFEAALDRALRLIREMPEIGPVVHRQLRRVMVPRFPYCLYYEFDDARIEVRACLHQRRDPGVLRGRL